MSLIECPDCHNKISSLAIACPHCARPMQSENKIVKKDIGEPGIFVVGALLVLLIGGANFGVGFVFGSLILSAFPAIIAANKGRSFLTWYCYGIMLWIFAIVHSIVVERLK